MPSEVADHLGGDAALGEQRAELDRSSTTARPPARWWPLTGEGQHARLTERHVAPCTTVKEQATTLVTLDEPPLAGEYVAEQMPDGSVVLRPTLQATLDAHGLTAVSLEEWQALAGVTLAPPDDEG